MKMKTLFTRQQEQALTILERDGVFRIQPEWIQRKYGDIASYFMKNYDWLAWESARRVPRPAGVTYPIWCSVDEGYMLREAPGEVVFQLSIPEDQVIFFDSSRWDMVLNHMYIPRDPADEAAFYQELSARGIRNPFTLLDDAESRFHPDLVRRIRDSWSRVFMITDWNMFTVQANIWEFSRDHIVEIRHGQMTPAADEV